MKIIHICLPNGMHFDIKTGDKVTYNSKGEVYLNGQRMAIKF